MPPDWVGWIIYNLFLLLWNTLDAIFLVIVALRAKYGEDIQNYPKGILVIISVLIAFTIVALIDQERTLTTPEVYATSLAYWSVWINRLVFYTIIVYVFYISEFSKTKRAVRSRNLWILSSIFWAIAITKSVTTNSLHELIYMNSGTTSDLPTTRSSMLPSQATFYNL